MNELSIRKAIESGSKAGNTALTAFANEAGDEAVREIVSNLTPAEVVATAITHDYTNPSLVHAFTSPEQFPEVFARFGQRWAALDEKAMEQLVAERQTELESFLCPMILGRHEDEEKAMLKSLTEHELGAEALVFIGLGRNHLQDTLATPNRAAAEKGTYEELYALTAEICPESWTEIKATIAEINLPEEKVRFALEFCAGFHEKPKEENNSLENPSTETTYLDI